MMEPEEIKYFSEKEMRIYDYINKNSDKLPIFIIYHYNYNVN